MTKPFWLAKGVWLKSFALVQFQYNPLVFPSEIPKLRFSRCLLDVFLGGPVIPTKTRLFGSLGCFMDHQSIRTGFFGTGFGFETSWGKAI